jgi:uncharacterized protein (TIGR00369 family)
VGGGDHGRTRTYTWEDPHELALALERRGGRAFLDELAAGRLQPPPIAETLGFSLVEAGVGRAVFACEPREFHYNPMGSVHGGLALTLIDAATGCAVQTVLPDGVGYTTLETKANFVGAITIGSGVVRCTGDTVHVGRSTATAQARVEDEQGRLLAHGTSTLLILAPVEGPTQLSPERAPG